MDPPHRQYIRQATQVEVWEMESQSFFPNLQLCLPHSPDLNLTPLAAFLRFLPSAASLAALGKNVKKQQEVSDLNQDYLPQSLQTHRSLNVLTFYAERWHIKISWQIFFVNSLSVKFCRGNINMYLHFISLLHIDMTQVLKILPQVKPGPTYSM